MKEGVRLSLSNASFLSVFAEKVKLLVKWYVGACIFLIHDGGMKDLGVHFNLIYGGGDDSGV